ncbi:MAG: LolA family protein [Gaiellaceae bacterium]
MKLFRTLPTSRLLLLLGSAVAALVVGVAIAVAASGGGPTPPPKPLPDAIHSALAAAPPPGISADISFTNGLLPSGALTGRAGSPLLSGATGRLWATNDGRGRLELQSDAGDVQIVWNRDRLTVYDATSNTVYRATLPRQTKPETARPATPSVPQISDALSKLGAAWSLTGAKPTDVGGRAAYSVRVSPKGPGSLLSAAEIAWDAVRGVPLRIAIYAKGVTKPVLALSVTNISFGAVPSSDVDVSPPPGAKVVDIPTSGGAGGGPTAPSVTGLAAVQAALPFHVSAPDTLGGLARTGVRLVGHGASQGALIVYGRDLGAVAVLERAATSHAGADPLAALPTVSIGSATAHELSIPLGTLLRWQRAGVETVLAGSVTASTAEADAVSLR